jgi:WD40 repeat protein
MQRFILGLCFLLGSSWLTAQVETDIHLLRIQSRDSSGWEFGDPRNITPRQGYDNQPSFTPDSKSLLFVSGDESGQTDVYRYEMANQTHYRLTDTRKRSEYSPQVMPRGKGYSAVVVEEDGTQRLWAFNFDDERGEVLMEDLTQIGYYAWYHRKRLGMFVITDPLTLQVTHVKRQRAEVVADSVGRSLAAAPGKRRLSYVDKGSDPWLIKVWDSRKNTHQTITPTVPSSEDFIWTPEGHLLMARESELYMFRPGQDEDWQSLGDLGIGNFYRLAISPDGRWLAAVSYQGPRP